MAPNGETRIQLCGRLVVRLEGRRVDDALPGALGQLLFVYLALNRLRRIHRDELLDGVYGEAATPDHQTRGSPYCSPRCVASPGPSCWSGKRSSSSRCRRTRSSTSRRRSTPSTGPNRTSQGQNGRPPGDRPVSPTTSRAGPCCNVTTGPGSTNGGDASTTSGSAGWSAWPRPASGSACRSCLRRRSARVARRARSSFLVESGYRILMESLERSGNGAEGLRVYDRLRTTLPDELGVPPSSSVQDVYRRLLGEA